MLQKEQQQQAQEEEEECKVREMYPSHQTTKDVFGIPAFSLLDKYENLGNSIKSHVGES